MKDEVQDPVLFRFFNEIGIIDQLAGNRLERVLPDGLKLSQFSVLNHLVRLGGSWSPARLAAAFQVTRAAMTNTLQRLESRGLVKIQTDPADARAKLVSLTRAGRKARQQCIESIEPLLGELLQEFGEKEFAAALPFLEKLRAFLDEHR